MLRRPYTVDARVHDGPGAPTVRLRWYRTDLDALPIDPPTVINSRDWDDEPWRILTVGEAPKPDAERSYNGQWTRPLAATGTHLCHPEWLASGEPWPNNLPPTEYLSGWIPTCCVEADMCPAEECTQAEISGEPASQHKQFAVDAVDAEISTPFTQFTVADALGGSSPDLRGASFEYFPKGTTAPAQFVALELADASGVPLAHVEQFTAPGVMEVTQTLDQAGWDVRVDNGSVAGGFAVGIVGGVVQLVADNAIIPAASIGGAPLAISQGGTGATTDSGARANLGLGTAAVQNIGTSGANVPLLTGVNQWSGFQTVRPITTGGDTNGVNVFRIGRETTGTPGVGFGIGIVRELETTTGAVRVAMSEEVFWLDPTDATRRARWAINLNHATGGAEIIKAQLNTSGVAELGFFTVGPVTRRTGDIGAGLVALGLFSGTPTVAASGVSGQLTSANLPDVYSGRVVGSSYVATAQATSSTTPVDLGTVQSVSFTLAAAATVIIEAAAVGNNSVANGITFLHADVDGTDTLLSTNQHPTATAQYPLAGIFEVALASGPHTIKLQFSVNAGTGTFQSRGLKVTFK